MSMMKLSKVHFRDAVSVPIGNSYAMETSIVDPKPLVGASQRANVEIWWVEGLVKVLDKDSGAIQFIPASNVKQMVPFVEKVKK